MMIDWLEVENEVKRLREENRELINKYVEIGSWVKTISDILEGKEPSDFMLSYPLVREVADNVSEVKRLREENERLRTKSIRNDSYMSEILNSGDGVYRP